MREKEKSSGGFFKRSLVIRFFWLYLTGLCVFYAYRKTGAGKLLQESRKLNCPAQVHMREIIKFPDHKVNNYKEKRTRIKQKIELESTSSFCTFP